MEPNTKYSLEGAKAKASILWPLDANSQLTEKDSDEGEDWGQEEKVTTEDEIVGWHHWLNAHDFEQIPRGSEGQGIMAHCSSWGHKEPDTTRWLNNNNK